MTRYVKLVGQLEHIAPVDEREAGSIVATLDRLTWPEDPFDERVSEHHVTASAFVVSARGVILLRHRLLGIWVQPGGHIDPGEGPEEAALRETLEETGLAVRHRSPVELFQVDVHLGPHGHTHYDLRYVMVAPPLDPSPGHGESREAYWFDFDAARERGEPALVHVLDKLDRATQRWNVKDFDGG